MFYYNKMLFSFSDTPMLHKIDQMMVYSRFNGRVDGWMHGWMHGRMDGWRVFSYSQTCLFLLSPSTSLQPSSSQAPEFYAVSILSLLRWCPLCSAPQGVSLWLLSLFQHVGLANRDAAKYNLLQMRTESLFLQ